METKYIVNNVSGQNINGDLTINGNVVITGTTNIRPYKVFTALLTQSGGSGVVAITSGSLTKGVTYNVTTASGGCDFTNVGGPSGITANGLSFVATENLEPNNWDGSELEYNTGAPVVIVLENTIGNIWFIYNTVGTYNCVSDSLFAEDKTTISLDAYGQDGNVGALITNTTVNNSAEFAIFTTKGAFMDDLLEKNRIEIKVYN